MYQIMYALSDVVSVFLSAPCISWLWTSWANSPSTATHSQRNPDKGDTEPKRSKEEGEESYPFALQEFYKM